MAGWSFPADGALAHSAARQLLGCAKLAACHFLDEVVARQIFSAGRVTLTCLHISLVWEPKLGSTLKFLEKSALQFFIQCRNSSWGNVTRSLVFLGGIF